MLVTLDFFIGLTGGRGEYGHEGVCLVFELCGLCLHCSCCHPCRRFPLEGSQCSTTLQFLRKLFGI